MGLLRRCLRALRRLIATLRRPAVAVVPAPLPVPMVQVQLRYWGGPYDGATVEDLAISHVAATSPGEQRVAQVVVRAITEHAATLDDLPILARFCGRYLTPEGDHGLVRFESAALPR